jgi:hypothetical protein
VGALITPDRVRELMRRLEFPQSSREHQRPVAHAEPKVPYRITIVTALCNAWSVIEG